MVAAAAAAAADGLALPTVFEQAAAGVAVGVAGSGGSQQLCIVRDEDAARMGSCEEQTRLTLQVRLGTRTPPTVSEIGLWTEEQASCDRMVRFCAGVGAVQLLLARACG